MVLNLNCIHLKFSNLNNLVNSKYGNLKKNIINSFYYFGGSFVGLLIGIFTQPVFSRNLEPYDFAVIGYFGAVQGFFMPLFSLNFTFYYLKSAWDTKSNTGKDLSFNLNFLNIANGIVTILTLLLIYFYFKLFKVNFPLYPFILLILSNLLLEKYKAYFLLDCRIQKKGPTFFLFTALQTITTTVFALFFVVTLNGGAFGRMAGQTTSGLILSTIAIIVFIRTGKYRISLKIDYKAVKEAFKFCYPLILGSYLYYPVSSLDRLLLERVGNVEEFGYYNLGFTIAAYAGTFFSTLYMAFEPDFYRLTALRKRKDYIKLAAIYLLIISVITVLLIFISGSIVAYLTSNRYLEATKYVNLLIISLYLYNVGSMFEQIFSSLESTKLSLYRNMLMAIISIPVYVILIARSEYLGAAQARIFIFIFYSFFGILLLVLKFSKRLHIINL